MSIKPLIQKSVLDVADWTSDAEFAAYPQGARAKDAVFAPDRPSDKVIVPSKRYLFKRSKRSYPDQFWGEIIAYRIGCLMGVNVPPAFVAWNSKTGISAALIEWFYLDGEVRQKLYPMFDRKDGAEIFHLGGDVLQNIHPTFDRKRGEMHNIQHIVELMEMLVEKELMENVWKQWLVNMLLFDALIGNTDRHQDNWGLVISSINLHFPIRLSPFFDNGTSLGHERFPERVSKWSSKQYDEYIIKGKHHVKWSLTDDIPIQGHVELLVKVFAKWPDTKKIAHDSLAFTQEDLNGSLADLVSLGGAVPLSHERIAFVLKLLSNRHTLLKSLFI